MLAEASKLDEYAVLTLGELFQSASPGFDKPTSEALERHRGKTVLSFVIEICEAGGLTEPDFGDYGYLVEIDIPGQVNPLGIFFDIFHAVKDLP